MTEKTTFKTWYEKNKEALSEQRKARYANDPDYRAKALANRKAQVARLAKARTPVPPQYTLKLSELPAETGISMWKLRDWKHKGYYPTPYFQREYWFTPAQAQLLMKLDAYLQDAPKKLATTSVEFEDLKAFITANW